MTIILNAVAEPSIIPHYHERTEQQLNVLVSYHFLKGVAYSFAKEHRDKIRHLYLDSGAYSGNTKNAKISLPEYREYDRRYGHLFDERFNLDDDFENPDHNFRNQVYLEEGLPENAKRPIPVIHDQHDPFGEFEMYANQGHSYIAVGSNQRSWEELLGQARDKYPDVKIHMFGTLNRKMLIEYRPYSADATTWAMAAGAGCIYYFDTNEKKDYRIDVGERSKRKGNVIHFNDFELKDDLNKFLDETFTYTRYDLLDGYKAKRIVNLYFFQQLEDYINSLD